MPDQTRIVAPGPSERSVRLPDGSVLTPPADWKLLPPGDATLTRRVKAAGPTWTVQERSGRRLYSRGVWAPSDRIDSIQADLAAKRITVEYARQRAAAEARRDRKQAAYVEEFYTAVLDFLGFAPAYYELGAQLARAVTDHATPVGSRTVARTERIPIQQRAESAVVAWLRHQTTTYDAMKLGRARGGRRKVRRLLADQSRQMLEAYRQGQPTRSDCPLRLALSYCSRSERA